MTTYYVSKSGNDSNLGTQSQPWLTIQKATNSIMAGDTVLVQRGTYNETVTINTSGLSNSARCVFSSYPGDERFVIIDGTSKSPSNGLVDIEANYLTFQNIKVQNTPPSIDEGTGIYAGAHHDMTIFNCYTYNTAGLGIHANGSSSILIDSNEVELAANGNWTECLDTMNCNGFDVRNNYVHDGGWGKSTGSPTNPLGGEGIDIFQSQNGTVHHNTVVNTYRNGIYLDGGSGLNQNIDVYSNVAHDFHQRAAAMSVATEYMAGNTNNIKFYNNILYNGALDGTVFVVDGAYGNINNVLIINNTIDGSIFMDGHYLSGITLSNNVYVTADSKNFTPVKNNNWEMYYQGSSGLFVNSTGHDYHLIAGSKLIDKGTSNGAPLFDFDGNSRPQGAGFDIGAYEYISTVPALSTIQISPISATIKRYYTKRLTSICKDQYGNVITCPILTWKSSNTRIATVNSTGLVKGISTGIAKITASASGITSNISNITIN